MKIDLNFQEREWRRSGNISSTCLNLTRGDFLNYVLKLPTFSEWNAIESSLMISVFSFHHSCMHSHFEHSHTMKIENGNYLHGLWKFSLSLHRIISCVWDEWEVENGFHSLCSVQPSNITDTTAPGCNSQSVRWAAVVTTELNSNSIPFDFQPTENSTNRTVHLTRMEKKFKIICAIWFDDVALQQNHLMIIYCFCWINL
jgi:hypothetical protein